MLSFFLNPKKPKSPGFGISPDFYLSVLSTKATLPSILQVINPAGEAGAVPGFGAPLAANAGKDALGLPIARGPYAIASKDRKTVLKMLVVSREEAGFDPEAVARHSEQLGLNAELATRIRAAWTLMQLRFESHDPTVYPSLDFVLAFCARLGELVDGAIADPLSQRYLLPDTVIARPRLNSAVDAREHVAVHARVRPDAVHIYTQGMRKFGLQELEISNLEVGGEALGEAFLMSAAQAALEGAAIREGQKVGAAKAPFVVREGGLDKGVWEGIPCFELLPPTSMTPGEALQAWRSER